jgi:hypothetical protein
MLSLSKHKTFFSKLIKNNCRENITLIWVRARQSNIILSSLIKVKQGQRLKLFSWQGC